MSKSLNGGASVSRREEEFELKRRGYTIDKIIGEGSYGKVKRAFSEKIQIRVAIKIINMNKAPKDFINKFLPRELRLHPMLDHINIIRMYEVLEFHNKMYLVLEYAEHGDLLDYIKARGALSDGRAKDVFRQMISGIGYLHCNNIVHRDMKCENILLVHGNTIKITDFGFARDYEPGDKSKTFCGSAAYAAPEVLQGIPYDCQLHDIWSLGVILYIMVCGSMPFDDSNVKKMIKDQLERKILFSRSTKISAECKDLIRKILEGNVQIRANLSIIKSHHWVRSPDISNGIETSGSTDRCKTTEAGTSTKTAEAEATLKTTEPTATLKTTAESEPTLKTTAESEPTLKTTEAEATLKTTEAEATLKTTAAEATLKTTEAEATLKTTEAEATLKMSEAEALLKQQKQEK